MSRRDEFATGRDPLTAHLQDEHEIPPGVYLSVSRIEKEGLGYHEALHKAIHRAYVTEHTHEDRAAR